MLKDKRHYINKYNKKVEEGRLDYIKENGNDNNYDSMEYIDTVDSIVGYYISAYGNEALKVWLDNLQYGVGHNTDNETTRVLTELYQ